MCLLRLKVLGRAAALLLDFFSGATKIEAMDPFARQGPGSEDDDDLDPESPSLPQPRTPLGFFEGPRPTSTFVRPETDAAFRMAMLVQSGRQEAADAIYRELTGTELPPRQQDSV